MKKLKKSLSIILTLVMLFTTFCFFPLDLGAIEAEAAISGIKIVVPETIYLTPSSGASTTGQYYVNNNSDGSVKTAYDTAASVAVTYPGAKLESVSVSNADIGAISGLNGTTLGSGAATASGAITLNSGLNAGSTALVEWIFVFTVNGKTQTHYAYSVAYAPWYQPVGAASKAVGAWHNTYASSILWVSGVHGYSDGSRANSWYVQTANFLPMLGTIKAPSNNNPDTNWIQSGSNGLSPTMAYNSITESGTNYHARANTISPTANITVDISRYSNFNQIPNFKVGFMVTDKDGITENKGTHAWYVSDYGTNNGNSYYNGTDRGGSQYTGDWNDTGTKIWYSDSDNACGIKVNQQSWNKAISGTADFRLKSAARSEYKATITSTGWNNNFVNISVTGANKGSLRSAVMAGTSYAKENYTSATWNEYYSALKSAATNLGNPTSSTVDTSTLTTKEAALQTTAYFDANGGTLGCAPSVDFVIGGNATASFPQTTLISAYPASRTGYTFKGWSTDKNATSAPETVTVGFNETVYAVWEANKYDVVFDNMFNFNAFNITGSLDINERTETGFTVTSTAGDGNTGFSVAMPVEPGKTYVFKADVQFEAVSGGYDMYVHTLDSTLAGDTTATPDTLNGAHREGNVYISLTGQTTNTTPYIRFTAGDNTAFIKIRFDANAVGNKLTVNNIRIYEEGTVADGVSYEAPVTVTYDSAYGTLPTPTKTGYEFLGWYDADGNQVSSADTVKITATQTLYSKWEIGNYTITFDTNGGSTISPISGNYGTAVTKPADPTKHGYLFTGWDKTIPDTIPAGDMTITASWSENSYSVYFDGNDHTGGTNVSQINTTYTGNVTIPGCTYAKTGYDFLYWTSNKDGSGTKYYPGDVVSKLTTVRDGGVTLYAQWAPTVYTITYEYNDGTDTKKEHSFSITDTVTAMDAPDRVGYTFTGWKVTKAEGIWTEGDVTQPEFTVNGGLYGNVTLTAQWQVNQYTISFDTLGGSAVSSITLDYGTEVNAPSDPTKTGYTFAGWEGLPEIMPAEDIIVTAKWTINSYTVTFDSNGGEAVAPITQEFGSSITAPAATREGYTFLGWSGLPETVPAENITATAQWQANTYTVTFHKNDEAAEGSMDAQQFAYDEAKALTAVVFTKTGYTFIGWAETADGEVKYENTAEVINLTSTADGEVALYAVWTINLYTVTFNYYTLTGENKTATVENVAHGTAFTDVELPADFTEVYYLANGTKNDPHYNFSAWANEVAEITGDTDFVAKYTPEEHSFSEILGVHKLPTCTEKGLDAYSCECGFSYQEETASLGHSWKETDRTATCTQDGYIISACSRTGCTATKQDFLPALGHIDGEWKVTTPAGCITKGTESHYCGRAECGEIYETREIDANGHSFTGVTGYNVPTCTEEGNEAYKSCSVCNLYFSENEETDSENGKALAEFILPANGHTTQYVAANAPTCTENGNIEYYTCANCDLLFSDADGKNVITDIAIGATGHDNTGEWVETTAPKCEEKGVETLYCKTCGVAIDTREVEAAGHDYGEIIEEVDSDCENEGTAAHYECSDCGKLFDADKNEVEADALVIPAKGHSYGTLIPEVPATCVSEGVKAHYTCSVCSKNFDENKAELDTLVIEKNNNHELHTVEAKAPTCDNFGWDEYQYCIREGCDYTEYVEIPAKGHDYQGVQTKNPTCTEKGEMTYICNNDSTHTYKEDIDALGHNEVSHEAKAATCEDFGWNAYVTCTRCDYTTYSQIDALGHDYRKIVTLPTCEDKGYTTYICNNDEAHTYVDNYVDATGHTEAEAIKENVVPSTCTVGGTYEEVIKCATCGEELSRTEKTTEPLGHKEAVRQINVSNATCTQEGSYDNETYCTVCDASLDIEHVPGALLPHTYTEQIIDEAHKKTDATCYSLAVYYYDCINCDATGNDEYTFTAGEKASHTMGTVVVIENEVAPSCYMEGSYDEVIYCSVCETQGIKTQMRRVKKTVDKIDHTPGEAKVEAFVDSTCYAEGSYNEVVYCSVCEAQGITEKLSTTEKTVEKKAHTPGEAKTEDFVDSTCYAEGSYNAVVYCSVCEAQGITEELSSTPKTIEKIAHTAGEPVQENRIESTCYMAGSYDEVVYCSVCAAAGKTEELSRVNKIIAKKAHTPGEAVEENYIDSTCYSEGSYDAVVYCSVAECHEKLSTTPKTIEKKAHTPGEAKTENFVDSTCYSEGSYNAVVYCSVCEAEGITEELSTTEMTVEKKAHTAGETVIENEVEPTCYMTGSYDKVTYCTVCEAAGKGQVQVTRETVTVDKVAHTPAEAVTENVVAPKCEEDGHYDVVVYCSVCAAADKKFEISRETITDPMTGHTEGEAKVENDVPAKCTVDGSYDLVVRCTVCDEIITSETKVHTAPGHTEGEAKVENDVPASCTVNGSYDLVVRCTVCNEIITSEAKVHTAPGHNEADAVIENDVPASCTVNGSYDEVVYCTVCGEVVSRETKVHTAPGHTEADAVIENDVPASCTVNGSYDEVVYCTVCGEEVSRETKVHTAPGHKAGEAVRENEHLPTETEDGFYESVVYCTVCGTELSRETIVLRPERTITFVLHGETIEVKSYLGEAVSAPEVPSYTTADGFIHQFKAWDKPLTEVTGNTTYTAVYTEPCDYTNLDKLEKTLNEVLEGDLADAGLIEANREQINSVLEQLDQINENRNTRDKSEQSIVDFVSGSVSDILDIIYPDVNSTLVINGSSVHYSGGPIELTAIKMPIGTTVNDAVWTSSDEKVVFVANGKLYAVGTGTVTITATKGMLKATKVISVVEGGNIRGITFTSIDRSHYVVEDYYTVSNSAIIYWSDDCELRFRVIVYQTFIFDDYIVYINGVATEADSDGYYTIPAGSGDVKVTIAGAIVEEGGENGEVVTKWSFWEWLLNLFRKIVAFFRGEL